MRIALGSLNAAKKKALELASEKVFPAAEIVCVKVPSGVSDQPTSDEETMTGAANRARAAQKEADAEFGVGMEGGYKKVGDLYFLCGWCAVAHRDGRVGYGTTGGLELSPKIMGMLATRKELAEVIDELTGRAEVHTQEGAAGIMTRGHVSRDVAFSNGLLLAFGRFISDPVFWE